MKKAFSKLASPQKRKHDDPKQAYETLKNYIAANDVDSIREYLLEITPKQMQKINNCYRSSLLHYACKRGRRRCIDLLIEAKSNINQLSKLASRETNSISYNHQTPLHVACEFGQLGAVKRLLQHRSVRLDVKDYHRCTPFELAKQKKHDDIILYLQTHKGITKKDPTLDLSNLRLKVNSPVFQDCESYFTDMLRKIDLSFNLLLGVPDALFTLTNLVELNLSNNAIPSIPSRISALESLEILDIDNNRIEVPPYAVALLPNLKTFKCRNNPLSYAPSHIKDKDSTILEFVRESNGGEVPSNRLKLICLGPTQSGKTTLLRNLRKETTTSISSVAPRKSTEQVVNTPDFSSTQTSELFLSNKISCSVLDVGANDLLFRTYQYFLTGRTIYILTFCSFEMNSRIIEHWLQEIKSASAMAKNIIVVAVTYVDDRKFDNQMLTQAKSIIEPFVNQSRVDRCVFIGNRSKENISTLKRTLEMLAEAHSLCGISISSTWYRLGLHCTYLREKQEIDTIEWPLFREIMLDCGNQTEKFPEVLEFLRDIGIIYYHVVSRSGEPSFVVLNPTWYLNQIVAIREYFLTNDITNGILAHDKLPSVWENETPTLIESLLHTFEVFEIAYCMRGEPPRSLFPSLLPLEFPNNVSMFWTPQVPADMQQYGRIYRFHVPSSDVFSRLIVRFLHILKIQALVMWRQGIILQLGDEIAIASYNSQEQSLIMKVRAPKQTCTSLLRALVSTVDALIESVYHNSEKIERLIPCLHCIRRNPYSSPYKFTKRECIEAWTSGSPFVYCHKIISNSRCVRVDILAPDLSFGDIPLIYDIEIGDQIGKGGFGNVYKGTLQGELVAIKELECAEDEGFASMFEEFSREVYIMSSLDHQNLVQFHGITVNPLRMVMQFVSGGDLYHILHSDQQLSLKLRLRIALDVAKGMKYLQNISPPIIHRDLRSPNILIETLDENAHVIAKVADFGLALSVAPFVAGYLGTWQWHAPEVLDSNSVFYDEKADIYSFGILLWEIFTSGYPFEEYRQDERYGHKVGTTEEGNEVWHFRIQNIKRSIIHDGLRPTWNHPDYVKVIEPCQHIIEKCWHPNKEKRPGFDIIVQKLRKILERLYPGAYRESRDGKSMTKTLPLFTSMASYSSDSEIETPSVKRRKKSKLALSDYEKRSDCFALHEKPICIHFAANKVWVGCDKGSLLVYNARDCSLITVHKSHQTRIYSVVSIARQIWASSEIGSLHVYDAINSSLLTEISRAHGSHMIRHLIALHQESLSCVWSCSPEQNQIAVWNSETFERVYSFKTNNIPINCFFIHFDEIWIGTHKEIEVFHIDYKNNSLVPVATLAGHTRKINHFEHPRSDEIWSCSDDGLIFVWSIANRSQISSMDVNSGSIRCLCTINNYVWSGAANKAIVCWSVMDKSPKHEIEISDAVLSIEKVGTSVWTGTADRKLRVIPHAAKEIE